VVSLSDWYLFPLNKDLEFEPCKWSTATLKKLYFLIDRTSSVGLVEVQWTLKYLSLDKKIKNFILM
jgi:hypothetical protein